MILMVFVIIKVNIKYFSNGILLAVNININIGHIHKLQILLFSLLCHYLRFVRKEI